MKRRLLWLLLIVSVCFNVFFLIGAAKARRTFQQLRTADGRARFVAERLDLDEDQTRAVGEVLRRQHIALKKLHDEHAADIEAYWDAALRTDRDSPPPDSMVERLAPMWKQGAVIRTACLREMLALLTREQQQAALDWLRKLAAAAR